MRRVQIASATQLAADAGAAVADAGGNAVDAAIGATIASMCTEIGIIAPAASGFLTIWPADGDPVVIDGYAEMPGRGLDRDRFGRGADRVSLTYGGYVETIVGWGSVATPGAFAAFEVAHEAFGTLPWADVMEPAIDAVSTGYRMTGASSEYLDHAHRAIFGWNAESSAIVHHEDGTPLSAGDSVHIPDLAETLTRVAERGARDLYEGELAEAISSSVLAGEGILTLEDLAAYEAITRRPIRVSVGEWEIATNPLPAVGGVVAAAMLLLALEPPFAGWTPEEIDRLARIQRGVLGFRADRLDDYEGRSAAAAEILDLARAGDLAALNRSPSTVHTSATDSDGAGCAITVSAGYGAGAVVPGTGMYLNNSLGEVELLVDGFHSLEPGTRLVSNMAPTVARRGDGSVIAIGSPGASRITTAVSQVLINFLHLGMSLTDSVTHPRIHVEAFDGEPTIAFEPGLDVRPIDDMGARRFPDISMYFGGVQTALWDPVGGLFGVADPRRSGGTARGGVD
ncbi:MAG: gamma-glutamyltransferase [Acidimicrobiia bacterium]|nr:MAG: gamma-glutamyltransferase [Acidimicrobiia bacterium]